MNPNTNISDLKAKSKLPAKQAGGGSVAAFFEANKASIKAVLPAHINPERMLKISLGAIRTTPKLMECTIESLFGAVVQCAQLGLEPNTAMGHAYLLPFNNRKANRTDVQLIVGYKGMLDLARRSGQIVSISAHEVCESDHFEYQYGLDECLNHRPALSGRGDVIAFYAVAQLKGGGHVFEVMSREQVEEIRNASQNYKFAKDKSSTVWGQHFAEMGRKTVTRRLFKWLPCSLEMATAMLLDEKAERGESQSMADALNADYIVTDISYADDEAPQEDSPQEQQEQEAAKPQQQKQRPESLEEKAARIAREQTQIPGL